jgi:branched-chain amino acid transport system substrate-binding protein
LIVQQQRLTKIVVWRSNSRPGRVGVRPFVDSVRRLGHPVLQEINFREGDTDFATQIAVIKQADPEAVVFWGNPAETGPAARRLRDAGLKAAFFGFDRVVDPEFVKLAGPAAEGMIAAYFFDPNKTDAPWTGFVSRFQKRFGLLPDIYAGYSYDGTQMLVEAVKQAGPNRYRVHDVMTSFNEYHGVTGYMRFDGRWDNIAPVVIAQFQKGRWHFQDAPGAKQTRASLDSH